MKQKNLINKINQLKKKHNAIILVHNYQLPEVQDIADFRGDSLELSRIAANTKAKVIVFCGVYFMAETASILCPDKKVIIPDKDSSCPLANMLTVKQLRALKEKYPKATVVGYVNTSAQVKAELDVCCTSTNAVKVINALKDKKQILFVPDKHLADYVSKVTGRRLITWDGFCPTHLCIRVSDIIREKKFHPKAKVIVHPECRKEVIALADEVLSTSGMAKFVKENRAREFIVGTEVGIIYRLKKDNPHKEFYAASEAAVCPNMKRITQEKVLWSLQTLKDEVCVSEEIRCRAKKAIERMLQIA
ncbi:MAG: quinolinate synthase NadA [Candidatus Omnitrophica bacterium]|nr:quinolinate synthase NadA [Candidatus Omnitrophota bacterium]